MRTSDAGPPCDGCSQKGRIVTYKSQFASALGMASEKDIS